MKHELNVMESKLSLKVIKSYSNKHFDGRHTYTLITPWLQVFHQTKDLRIIWQCALSRSTKGIFQALQQNYMLCKLLTFIVKNEIIHLTIRKSPQNPDMGIVYWCEEIRRWKRVWQTHSVAAELHMTFMWPSRAQADSNSCKHLRTDITVRKHSSLRYTQCAEQCVCLVSFYMIIN